MDSPAHISRSGSGTRRTTAPSTHALGLPDGDLEPSEHRQEHLVNSQPDKPKLPWWKTPSPWWLLMIMPFIAIAASITIAPHIEIYTTLACNILRPDYGESPPSDILRFLPLNDCRIPAVAHQSSCVDISDVFMIDKSLQTNAADDPPPTRKQRCASDPVVQAAVAKLSTFISASSGILSCITTGWWGAFSDRHGRKSVIGISVIGLLLVDFNVIIVTLFPRHIPGGYWFLVVGPMVQGALGGMNGGAVAIFAYLADTSNEGNRSRIFSLILGLSYIGMALGPTLGSLLIRFTGQVLSVFYLAGCLLLIYSFLVWFVIPESLTKGHMELAKAKYADSLVRAEQDSGLVAGFSKTAQRLFSFLRPLAILGPTEKAPGDTLKGRRKDWNLTLLAVAYGFTVSVLGLSNYTIQYTAVAFGWSSETLGYWMSTGSVVHSIFLAIILPTAIKILKPKPLILELPVTPVEATPLLDSSSSMSPKTIKKEIHSPLFDLNLARASLLVEMVSYTSMGLAQSPILFALSSFFDSMGAGFPPAVQSVALALYAKKGGVETGSLLGALSLIQALSTQIFAPFIYGFVFVKTVAIYPRMVFFVSAVAISISYCLMSLVRIPKDDEYHRQGLADFEESGSNEEPSIPRAQEST